MGESIIPKTSDEESPSIRSINQQKIKTDDKCQITIQKMLNIEGFLSGYGFLSFGRDFVLLNNQIISLQIIITSSELTAGSIISCCEAGCFADANTLLRKLRDDLFFYLYIMEYDRRRKLGVEDQRTKSMEKNIEKWINNTLNDLPIGEVLKAISQSAATREAVSRYKLKEYFTNISRRLNDYVHGNGIGFYNNNVYAISDDVRHKQIYAILEDMRFITVTFLFLLTLCSPLSIMSTDYIDALDCGYPPPEGSQYWVPPFIVDFFKTNLDLIDGNCLSYLKENTSMEIE